ncbi:hypothetical protein BFS30_21460 [Pedobacter steynii]|uniref:HNH endonuclease n=1 Tax=Pedobacter steynii TaxID=430522 RepID=A0A1D7QQI7_9SPHI|nr:hypothetical protein BFS30_21460 [Pedobacter steynii]
MPDKHGSYGALLFDRRWKDKRSSILIRDNNKCVICGFAEGLQVHHRQYLYVTALKKFKSPWDYSDKTLITLCNSCHQRGHSKFKVPIIYI